LLSARRRPNPFSFAHNLREKRLGIGIVFILFGNDVARVVAVGGVHTEHLLATRISSFLVAQLGAPGGTLAEINIHQFVDAGK
jgi:hypothetical protein